MTTDRNFNLLPVENQTPSLKDFFSSTVDEVFQPGTATQIDGYIGEVPQYNNPTTDFYLQEPTASRSFYQLEPGMVSINSNDVIQNSLTYPDLINYLNSAGAITSNNQRLFDSTYYSWCPPIDIDKFVNFQQYYWFGTVDGLAQLPKLTISSPILQFSGDGTTTSFALPPSISGIAVSQETHAIYVNGNKQTFTESNGVVTLAVAPPSKSIIITTRFDNLEVCISNQTSFTVENFISYSNIYSIENISTSFAIPQTIDLTQNISTLIVYYAPTGNTPSASLSVTTDYTIVNNEIILNFIPNVHDTVEVVVYNGVSTLNTLSGNTNTLISYLSSGMIITLNDTSSYFNNISNTYFVDGVGDTIHLTNIAKMNNVGISAQYTTIDRTSNDKNLWSLSNFWINKNTFSWTNKTINVAPAAYPIIEFVPNIVLYNYGTTVSDVKINATVNGNAQTIFGQQIAFSQIENQNVGFVYCDKNVLLTPGMNILDVQTNNIYSVSISSVNSYVLTELNLNVTNTIITITNPSYFSNNSINIWFNGSEWLASQVWSESVDPLFELYDITGNSLLNYTNNNFTGSRIFGYEIGKNYISALAKSINYDANGYIMFSNDISLTQYTYKPSTTSLSITGLYCYGINYNVIETFSLWNESSTPTSQSLINGLYTVPLNLSANPLWEDVGILSKSQYIFHFSEIIENQINFSGQVYSNNNYRDSLKDGSLGKEILQHCSPLLKTMLLASNSEFDLLNAIRFANQEYLRFKNKFAKKLTTLENQGKIQSNDSVQTIVNVVLKSIITDKNNSFPFWLSTMAGGNYFIPPTPAFLGIMPTAVPMLIDDASYSPLVTMIIGHDNSYTPAFNDWRDNVILELETQIYNSIPSTFVDNERPVFDIQNYIYNRFYNPQIAPISESITNLALNTTYPIGSTFGAGNNFAPVLDTSFAPLFPNSNVVVTSANNLGGDTNCLDVVWDTALSNSSTQVTQSIFVWIPSSFTGYGVGVRGDALSNTSNIVTANLNLRDQWQRIQITGYGAYIMVCYCIAGSIGDTLYFTAPQVELGSSVSSYVANNSTTPLTQKSTGNFIGNGYYLGEINSMLSPTFELWAQFGNFDYRTNTIFDPTNPFTWNYRGIADQFGNSLPGNYRAIYRWYFDTDKPNIAPWEMLGFTTQPSWWTAEYGTNYSRLNTSLWSDLEDGFIRQGQRMGIDIRYARPGLSKFIPVDNLGNLIDPISANIVSFAPTMEMAARPWAFGDQGPAENLWRTSSSYYFALSQVAFLTKPARFVETNWDTVNFQFINNQWVDIRTYQRPVTNNLLVHGEFNTNGTYNSVFGIQQWLVDNLVFSGKSPSLLGNATRGLNVQLIHPMASFVSSDNISVLADNFGLISSESIDVILYTGPPISSPVYSGVIIEWTGNAYQVIGYDAKNPVFPVIPPDTNSLFNYISLNNTPQPIITVWGPNINYRTGVYVNYEGSVYICITNHKSGNTFYESYWQPTPGVSDTIAPSALIYSGQLPFVVNVTYGTVFNTIQDVVNFLVGYGNYLISVGFVFDSIDPTTNLNNDFILASKNFLDWSQGNWTPGTFIALSPGALSLQFVTNQGTVLNVENSISGFYGLLDRSGNSIPQSAVRTNRPSVGQITLNAIDYDIFCSRIQVSDIEHALVFSNIDIFGNVIYLPLYNQRQKRLRMTGFTSSNWSGCLEAPGYVVNGSLMYSNFDKTVEDMRLMFDIEKSSNPVFTQGARSNIGYQPQTFLEDILISSVEQFEFYLGMIAQKGTPGVLQKLLRSVIVTNSSNIVFLEEWAILTDTFGAKPNPLTTFLLQLSSIIRDPQYISLINPAISSPDWVMIDSFVDPAQNDFFPTTTNGPVVPTAGFVRINEVQYTAFNIADLTQYFLNEYQQNVIIFNTGERVWLYQNAANTWDILRVFDLGDTLNQVVSVTVGTTTGAIIECSVSHNLTSSDIGASIVFNTTTFTINDLVGIQTIASIINSTTFTITNNVSTGFVFTGTTNPPPDIKILRSMRFPDVNTLDAFSHPLLSTDYAWVNNYNNLGLNVLQYGTNSIWSVYRSQPVRQDPSQIKTASLYNNSSVINNDQLLVSTPLIDDFTIIDPIMGYFPGAALDQIDFTSDIDPAIYAGGQIWGVEHVGRVWWNTSSTYFLDPYTDTLGVSAQRDFSEISNRISSWSTLAPNCSINVYEWVQSTLSPTDYQTIAATDTTGAYGIIYNINEYVSISKYNVATGLYVTYYYFWVSNLKVTPSVNFRTLSISSIASFITNPTSQNLPWIAPITPNSILLSGMVSYLNETSSVVKIELISLSEDDKTHSQWSLMRPNDPTSLPSDDLWRKVRNSLAGFDDNLNIVPYPTINPYRATGLGQGQSLFTASGIMDGRQSFVTMINNILAETPVIIDRAQNIASLNRSQTLSENMFWYRTNFSYGIEYPPSFQYDYHVYSIEERNQLVLSAQFQNAVATNTNYRVFVDNTNSTNPTWSVWLFNTEIINKMISNDIINNVSYNLTTLLIDNLDTIFTLYTSYDISVSTYADMLLLTPSNGQRIYVETDETCDELWTLYIYENGTYTLKQAQAYRTSDFYSIVNWYAQNITISNQIVSYSSLNPPMVNYSSAAERNASEGTTPANLFVSIGDLSSNTWIWTAFDITTNSWITVALASGTIALSNEFYNSSNVYFNPYAPIANNSYIRDGSWELRVLTDILFYDGLLLPIEINELFFSLVHFIHSQQDNVEWIFKTSFMTIAGYSIPLIQSGVETTSIATSLQPYVNEVKPYRVKIRSFEQQYAPAVDQANTHATDFDNTSYFDPILQVYRSLDLSNPPDVVILQTKEPWKDWYNNYLLPVNQVRKMNITLLFDRVAGYDSSFGDNYGVQYDVYDSFAGTALDRINKYYTPSATMPPLNAALLLNLNFRGDIIDGSTMNILSNPASEFDDTPFDTTPFDIQETNLGITNIVDGNNTGNETVNINPGSNGNNNGYGLRDPYVGSNHPEERIPLKINDSVNLNVTSLSQPGMPSQTSKYFDVTMYDGAPNVTLFHGLSAQAGNAVFVWRNGIRLNLTEDYTVNMVAKTITLNMYDDTGLIASDVIIRVFGFGSPYSVLETDYYIGSVNGNDIFQINNVVPITQIIVLVNGTIVNNFNLRGNSIQLPFLAYETDDVVINIFSDNVSNNVNILEQTLPYNNINAWALSYPDNHSVPAHAATIVEKNGIRLTPPLTYYGNITITRRYIQLDAVPAGVTIYVNGVLYNYSVPVATAGNSNLPFGVTVSQLPNNTDGMFAIYGDLIISLDPSFNQNNICVVVQASGDYSINSGIITVNTSILSTDILKVTTFSNANMLNAKTYTYLINSTGAYEMEALNGAQYILASAAGLGISPEKDFNISFEPIGFDQSGLDDNLFDINYHSNVISRMMINNLNYTGTNYIVATVFDGIPARETINWMAVTKTPSPLRMIPILNDGGFADTEYEANNFDSNTNFATAAPRYGKLDVYGNPVLSPIYSMDGAWDFVRLNQLMSGSLANNLGFADTSLQIIPVAIPSLNQYNLFYTDGTVPGVIYIKGERIEYLSSVYENGIYTLGILTRGTYGTSATSEIRKVSYFVGDGTTTEFVINYVSPFIEMDVKIGSSWQLENNQFTIISGQTSTTIKFTTAPLSGSNIIIGVTLNNEVLAGSIVYDGNQSINTPVTTSPTNRQDPTIQFLIEG